MKWTLLALVFFCAALAEAYPSFISYGYQNCVTCHFNGQGNGPLNDYGRALFSAEIASKAFYKEGTTDEELAESSGFLGKTQLPSWLRPGIKVRQLWFQLDPGSDRAMNRDVLMQADLSLAFLLNGQQKWIVVASGGYIPTPQALATSSGTIDKPGNFISREHYIRWNPNKQWFVYLGLMDKVFGIRTADHTAYSRSKTGLSQNDQSDGMVIQYNADNSWEYTFNPFIGNLSQDSDLRQVGASFMAEVPIAEKHRVGGTILTSKNDYTEWMRAELHSKQGFGSNSLLAEIGIIQDKPRGTEASTGSYLFLESLALVTRGYNFMTQVEYYNRTMSAKTPDQIRWSIGMLAFPAPRFEVRTMLVNGRTQADSGVTDDRWQVQLQIHLSL